MEHFEWIADERRALATLIEGLTDEQLATQSLCEQWSVRQVFGHLVVPLTVSLPAVMIEMAKSRGNFQVANVAMAKKAAQRTPARLAEILRDKADSHFVPPGGDWRFPLADVVVHGQDIRRPLGLARGFDADRMRVLLDFVVSAEAARGFVKRGRLDGLKLRASDQPWGFGNGPLVEGPAEALLLVATGRPAGLADLAGAGVEMLSERLG